MLDGTVAEVLCTLVLWFVILIFARGLDILRNTKPSLLGQERQKTVLM